MPIDASLYGQQQPVRINTPFENLSQVLQVRNQQEANRTLAEQRAAQAQQTRERTALLQQQQADTASLDDALGQGGTPDEILARVPGHLKSLVRKQFQESDDYNRKVQEAKRAAEKAEIDYAAHGAASIKAWERYGPDAMMNAAKAFLVKAKRDGHDVSELEQALTQDPGSLPARLDAVIALSQGPQAPKPPVEVNPGNTLVDPQTGKVVYTAPPKEPTGAKPASVQEYEYAVAHDGFKGSFTDYQNADANRKQQAASARAPYFTYQTTFDAQGRPTGAIRFDARGGPPQKVDIGEITGGSQLKPPPGTTGAQAIGNEVSTAQLDRLVGMFNRGGRAFIGPVEGRARSIGQQLPGVPVNKTFADFDAASSAFKNSVIKAITGAQMSEREADRIIGQIPTVNDKPDVWRAKAEQTRKNLQDLSEALAKKSGGAPKADPLGIR